MSTDRITETTHTTSSLILQNGIDFTHFFTKAQQMFMSP